jgi:hypothetical protein
MQTLRTEKDVENASRPELEAFMTLNSGDWLDPEQNLEALRGDVLSRLEEMIDAGEIAYTFAELDDAAKYKVIDWLAPDHDWWQDSLDYFKEKATEMGMSLDSFSWYGDEGVAWEGDVYLDAYLAVAYPEEKDVFKRTVLEVLVQNDNIDGRVSIGAQWRQGTHVTGFDYNFEDAHTIEIEGLFRGANVLALVESLGGTYDKVMQEFEEEIQDAVEVLCHDMDACLRKEEDYYQSEEYAQEMCDANDYWFDSKGNMVDAPVPATVPDSQQSLAFETSGV